MNDRIKSTCDLILENKDALEKKMAWEADSKTYAIMAGLLTAANGIKANTEKYQECKEILKKNAGFFSEMRGLAGAVVAVKMMMSDNPEAYVKGVVEVYNRLCDTRVLTSPYVVMAAINIYEHNGVAGANADIAKLNGLYKELKQKHPLLVNDADLGYLSMITASGINADSIAKKVDDVYDACKKLSFDKDAVHSMAQLLALSDKSPEDKVTFISEMLKELEKNNTPVSKDHGLPVLGALSLLGIEKEQLINDIKEVSNYLKGKRGFKWYESGKRMRNVYAALIVFVAYAKDNDSLGSVISSNIAMSIAEEIIMLIIGISVSTSVTASSIK